MGQSSSLKSFAYVVYLTTLSVVSFVITKQGLYPLGLDIRTVISVVIEQLR
jgi:hypothetical protein